MQIPVIIDTDIGSDIDDILALLTAFGSPELEIVGITATYGDTVLRARIVKQLCDLAGIDVPIGAGEKVTLSGRNVWLAGYEDELLDPDATAATFEPRKATEVISNAARSHAGELVIVGIGPLTNLANALEEDPQIESMVSQLVVMGGDFSASPGSEHNVISDVVAAARLFKTVIPVRMIGVDQTRRLRVPRDEILSLAAGKGALQKFVRREIDRWLTHNQMPAVLLHDPLTVTMLTNQRQYQLERGSIEVGTAGSEEGVTSFTTNGGALSEVVRSIDEEPLRSAVLERIARALGR
jgi:purine nucleosidase